MTPEKVFQDLSLLETSFVKKRTTDLNTKGRVISLMRNAKKLVGYRIPKEPIDISDDGRLFTCPTCGTKMMAEEGDTVKDFSLCYFCGQLFKEYKED